MRSRLWLARHHPHRGEGSAGAQVRCSFFWGGRPARARLASASGGEPGRDLDARVEAELVEDVMHVVVDRALGEEQALRDLAVGDARREQLRDLALALAEP